MVDKFQAFDSGNETMKDIAFPAVKCSHTNKSFSLREKVRNVVRNVLVAGMDFRRKEMLIL